MRRQVGGFILPLTFWILAAVTVVAVYFAERVQRSLQLAESRQQLNDAQIALSNARAELLLRLGTQPMAPCGMGAVPNCVALDNRAYALESTVLQLQDERGLFNLNQSDDRQLDRLLATYQVPPDRRANLIDTLRDYIDEDSSRRLNGAESLEYRSRALLPPRNQRLLTPLELKSVDGWTETAALWKTTPITELVSVGSSTGINPNTATLQVLQALPGVTPEVAAAIVERRRLDPVSADLVDRMAGGGLMQLPPLVIGFPADTVRVTQSVPGLPWVHRYNVLLTPTDPVAPWQVVYFHRLEKKPGPESAANFQPPAKLPPRVVLPATPALLSTP